MVDVLVAVLVVDKILQEMEQENKNKKKKRIWVKKWMQKKTKWSSSHLVTELRLTCPEDYRNYLRMSGDTYDELLAKVKPFIERQNTFMRDSISPNERLSATLRFLATGRSYSDMRFSTFIAKSTLSSIIIETCQVIRKVLKHFIVVRT